MATDAHDQRREAFVPSFHLASCAAMILCAATLATGRRSGCPLSREHDYERSANDGNANTVDPPVSRDTEHGQWVLCRDLSVWIRRSPPLCLCVPSTLRLCAACLCAACLCTSAPVCVSLVQGGIW